MRFSTKDPSSKNLLKRVSGPRGFSLVELLVVIGIIGLLVGLLLPTIGRARASAQRVTCQSQLRDIGNMFSMYLNENKQRVPRVNPVPSVTPKVVSDAPSFVEVMRPYHKGATQVFSCPSDKITLIDMTSSNPQAPTYYEREGLSYEYNTFFNAFAFKRTDPNDLDVGVNMTWQDAITDWQSRRRSWSPNANKRPISDLRLINDFENFHGKANERSRRNYLYADFSVDGDRSMDRQR